MSQQINLYNPRFRKKTNYVTLNALAALAVVTLAGALAFAMVARQRVVVAQAEADKVQRQMNEVEQQQKASASKAPAQKDPQVAVQLAQAEYDNRALQEVSNILEKGELGNTRGYSAYFSAFARSRVQGLWLTGVQIVGAGHEIGLQGRALQAGLLPGYLNGLAHEPVLKGKAFGQLEMNQAGQPAAAAPAASTAAAAAAAGPAVVEFSLQAHQENGAPAKAGAK
ncbi:MSHA biogenesis protein MshA [Duganella sp. FT92W]|uniref:MSHA biogenesis protein MshA n=1 Tax=Pseudoduganella rivuli TaxID=2666085 RepID=A0A7X2LT58_9BURK|nr:MSHA biogenesis protein MshA [Pseudoduganella rivuli]MRV71489.1 MSHA biogenesis protein MshA [Pseudoduganella rivuli]